MRNHDYWVYIVTNKLNTTLYIGITNDLQRRIGEHRAGEIEGFAQRYSLKRLMWFEHFRNVDDAIACEKKMKGWVRRKKNALIAEKNPRWLDLGSAMFDQMPNVTRELSADEMIGDPSLLSG